MKKILLILLIVLASLPHLSAAVYDWFTYDGLNYIVLSEDDLTVEVGKYSSASGDLSIPSIVTYNGTDYTVTSIGNYALYWCSSLTSVTIPSSVTSIGENAFKGCSSLTEINVEAGSEYFCSDNGVLYNVDKTILIQGPGAIKECEIPNSVTSIRENAFNGCGNLTSVTIPNSVTSIGNRAFSDCRSLTSVTIPNSVTAIGGSTFSGCSSLTSVTIPNSVTSIGEYAFSWCSLTSVTIPNSVTSIGHSVFSYCSNLTSVTIPNSVTSIADGTFSDCIYNHRTTKTNQKYPSVNL